MKHNLATTMSLCLLLFVSPGAGSQNLDKARQLHSEYRFAEAVELCEKLMSSAVSQEEKEQIFAQMVLSENGQSMLTFSCDPQVVAKKTVPRKDFFLWYSHLSDKCWTADGNWYPEGAERYYFSENGSIFTTSKKDSVEWSAPEPPAPDINSKGSEIFPFISPDGKQLFFSSNGLFGMGGYDLFVSEWNSDENRWGQVQNVGFPFSSVADDLLLTFTPDNNYIIFASDRECGKDNVVIYVVRYENYLRKMVSESDAPSVAKLPAVGGSGKEYAFVKHSPRSKPVLQIEPVEPEIDYSFRVGKESEIVPDNTLPKGVVYQVRIFVTNSKVKKSQLKGFSPVFEVRQKTGKYIYYVGLFRTYKEASAALKQVKTRIPGAYLVAFDSGKTMNVTKAREKEASVKVVEEEVRIID